MGRELGFVEMVRAWSGNGSGARQSHFDMPNSDPVPQGTFVEVDELLPCSLSPCQAGIPVPSPHSSGILLFKELAIFLANGCPKKRMDEENG